MVTLPPRQAIEFVWSRTPHNTTITIGEASGILYLGCGWSAAIVYAEPDGSFSQPKLVEACWQIRRGPSPFWKFFVYGLAAASIYFFSRGFPK